jgi:hypothetical protein
MKYLVFIVASVFALNAEATDQFQAQGQIQGQAQSLMNSNPLSIGGDRASFPLQIPPTPPAIAPAQSVNNDCQIATPKANAWSAILVSVSYTDGVVYNDLCYAYKRGQFDVADRLMCAKSADYKAANPSVCNPS